MIKLYHGKFNYQGEVHEFWRSTTSPARAFFYMTRELARILGVTHSSIKYYYGGIKNNYIIREK